MTHTYSIKGMTCGGCVAKVQKALSRIDGVATVDISLENNTAHIDMTEHIATPRLQKALADIGDYQITTIQQADHHASPSAPSQATKEDIEPTDYRKLYPLFLVFAYLISAVLLRQWYVGYWNSMEVMINFMGGFFIIFSFFKLLDLNGFVSSFSTYDPITKVWNGYGYLYPFIELGLGIAFLTRIDLFWTNVLTLIIVGIGTIGVAQAVLNKRSIQCACLGTVFNLPMTKVTLTENSIMIIMAISMLFFQIS